MFSTGLLFFALLGAALSLAADAGVAFASQRWISGASAAELIPLFVLAIACIAITARDPQIPRMIADAYSKNVHSAPMSSMGPVLPEDIRLARAVTATVRGTEKILLPGVV